MAGTIARNPDPSGPYPGKTIQIESNKVDPKSVAAVAYVAGFRGRNWTTAVAVSFAENGSHDTNAQHLNANKSVDTGLWQINSVHGIPIRDLFDGQRNANAAWAISSHGKDWTPWYTYPIQSGALMTKAQLTIYDLVHNHGGAAEWLKNNPLSNPGALGGITRNVTNPIDSVTGALDSIGSGLSFITDSHNWYRLGQIVIGAALLLIGLYVTVKASPANSLIAT